MPVYQLPVCIASVILCHKSYYKPSPKTNSNAQEKFPEGQTFSGESNH